MNTEVFREVRDSSGRVVIRESDDRGCLFPIIQNKGANCRGLGSFTEVWRSENMQRARRGHISYSIDVTTNDAFNGFLYLEVNVIGYVNGASEVLQYTTLDRFALAEFEWFDPDTFSAIALEARQNLNGTVSDSTLGIDTLNLNVSGGYWR